MTALAGRGDARETSRRALDARPGSGWPGAQAREREVDAVEYEFIDFSGFRYEDLAGNLIVGQQLVSQSGQGS